MLSWSELLGVGNNTEGGGESVLSSNLPNLPYLIFWNILAYQYHKTMSMNKENRQSHQRTQDVRWKPNAGEKPPAAIMSLSSFKKFFLQWFCTGAVLYQHAGCNLQRATTLSRFPDFSWKGATTPYFFFKMINKYTTDTVYYRYQISNYWNNPEHLMNRNIQLTDHLETGTHIFFLWPATGRSIPYAVLRADALLLLLVCDWRTYQHYRAASFASGTHPIPQSRRVLCFRDAPNTTVEPRPSLQRRTWSFTVLRPGALSLHWICVPLDMEDKRTSEPTQTLRSTDLIMRQIDRSPLEDLPLKIWTRSHQEMINQKWCLIQMNSSALYRQASPQNMEQYHEPTS